MNNTPATPPANLRAYPGRKGASGTPQALINLLPPHDRYIELFAGSAALYWSKRPARTSILVESNPDQADKLAAATATRTDTAVICADALSLLANSRFQPADLLYLDPPYLHSTRTARLLYGEYELTESQHETLLHTLANIHSQWILSGYDSPLYEAYRARNNWRRIDWQAMTRGGPRTESAWLNFASTSDLAEYTVLGTNYRERERIKRKVQRWTKRLASLDPLEQAALENAMRDRTRTS